MDQHAKAENRQAASDFDSLLNKGARIAAMVGCVWFAIAISWGLFAPSASGHYAAAAGAAILSENIYKFKTWGSAWNYGIKPPPLSDYYCHHPLGEYWVGAILHAIVGHSNLALRLHDIIMSALTPVLFYKIAKRAWGVVAGAAAVWGFVMLPIELGFGAYFSQEVPVIFGCALFFWSQSRVTETGQARYVWLGGLGVFFATFDWPGYIIVGVVLGYSFLRTFLLPARLFPQLPRWPYARWWAVSASVAVLTLVLCVALFHKADKVTEWLDMGTRRGGGGEAVPGGNPLKALEQAFEGRLVWVNEMLTPLAISIGKFALPILLLRLLVTRADADVYSLAVFTGAAVHYLAFKHAADIHIFWSHYFAPYFALALAGLTATVQDLGRYIARTLGSARVRTIATGVALCTAVGPALLNTPDVLRMNKLGHNSGGRYDNKGNRIVAEDDKMWVLQNVVAPQMKWGDTLDFNRPSLEGIGWEGSWAVHAMDQGVGDPAPPGPRNASHPFWVARASALGSEALKRVAKGWHVRAYGDIWVVDQREGYAPLDAYSEDERDPNLLESYLFTSGFFARTLKTKPDPFLTWEWRLHVGEMTNDEPTAEPTTLDELRIAYNLAIARGDSSNAGRFRTKINSRLDTSRAVEFQQGMKLIGVHTDVDSFPIIDAWFEAAGGLDGDATLSVKGTVEAKLPFSLMPVDPGVRDIPTAPFIPARLMRRGFLYTARIETMHRVGVERFSATWVGPGSQQLRKPDGKPFDLDVLR